MIEWFENLPQKSGWYMWHNVDDPFYSSYGVVYIANLTDYKRPEEVRNNEATIYKNEAGQELVICWDHFFGQRNKPFIKDGIPVVDAWAEFNFPPVFKVRDIRQYLTPIENG